MDSFQRPKLEHVHPINAIANSQIARGEQRPIIINEIGNAPAPIDSEL
jgi:hypothetical protein